MQYDSYVVRVAEYEAIDYLFRDSTLCPPKRRESWARKGSAVGVRTHLQHPPEEKRSGDATNPGMETGLSPQCQRGGTTRDARHPNVDLLKCYQHVPNVRVLVFEYLKISLLS